MAQNEGLEICRERGRGRGREREREREREGEEEGEGEREWDREREREREKRGKNDGFNFPAKMLVIYVVWPPTCNDRENHANHTHIYTAKHL